MQSIYLNNVAPLLKNAFSLQSWRKLIISLSFFFEQHIYLFTAAIVNDEILLLCLYTSVSKLKNQNISLLKNVLLIHSHVLGGLI